MEYQYQSNHWIYRGW